MSAQRQGSAAGGFKSASGASVRKPPLRCSDSLGIGRAMIARDGTGCVPQDTIAVLELR